MTDTASTKSSPPSTLPFVSPRETPPYSPGVRSNHSSSPASATSPLPPLPVEVFLNVLSYLLQDDIERLILVSRAWNSYLVNEPRLWHTVRASLGDADQTRIDRICRRSTVNGRRSSGGIRKLDLYLPYVTRQGRYGDYVEAGWAVRRLHEILEAVTEASVLHNGLDRPPPDRSHAPTPHSTLTSFGFKLYPNTLATAQVLLYFANHYSYAPLFVNLEDVDLYTALPGFKLRDHVLRMWPHLVTLQITVPTTSYRPFLEIDTGTWSFQPPHVPRLTHHPSLDRLTRLDLSGTTVSRLAFPLFPSLQHLYLRDVTWRGRSFFFLLRLARKTLESLVCHDLHLAAVQDEIEDWDKFVDIREPELTDDHFFPDVDEDQLTEPAPIMFPLLRRMVLTGYTPAIFSSLDAFEISPESELLPTPIFVMPALDTIEMDEVNVDPENGALDDQFSPLATLGGSAPQLQHVTFRSMAIGDEALHCCLAALSVSILTLDVSDTYVSDHFVVRIPDIAPLLKVLDVRQCLEVTCQGVARAVEVMRMRHDEGDSKLEKVHVSMPSADADPACWRAWRWLDFVGVLQRDEDDFEGFGPVDDPKRRRRWVREGKKDMMHEYVERWRDEDRRKVAEAEQSALILATQVAAAGGGRSGHAYDPTALQALAALQQGHLPLPPSATAADGPLPPGLNFRSFPLPAPVVPSATALSYASGGSSAPHRPIPHPYPSAQLASSRLPPQVLAAQRQGQLPPPLTQAQQQPHSLPSCPLSAPPAVPTAPTPPQQHATETLDLSSLDQLDTADLDPRLLAEQQLAYEQAQQRAEKKLAAEVAAAQQRIGSRNGNEGQDEMRRRWVAAQHAAVAAAQTPTPVPRQPNPQTAPTSEGGTPMQMTPRGQTPANPAAVAAPAAQVVYRAPVAAADLGWAGSDETEEEDFDEVEDADGEADREAMLDFEEDETLEEADEIEDGEDEEVVAAAAAR
ncbi:hypothetical protein JCM8097_005198 [Rhodosporidiobolus ruineniae]